MAAPRNCKKLRIDLLNVKWKFFSRQDRHLDYISKTLETLLIYNTPLPLCDFDDEVAVL